MIRRTALVSVAVLLLGGVTLGLSKLRPAAPSVDRATVWTDEVKRGPMLREVRGLGTLIPEDIRWIAAQTDSHVDRVVLHPGALVKPDSIILELSDLQLQRDALDAVDGDLYRLLRGHVFLRDVGFRLRPKLL